MSSSRDSSWIPAFTENDRSGSSDRVSNSNKTIDRALGMVATLGVSVAILRLILYAVRLKRRGSLPLFLHPILQVVLKTLYFDEDQVADGVDDDEDRELVRHLGSCHCKVIQFELWAQKRVVARLHPNGKLKFPRVKTIARHFQLIEGTQHMKMYYLSIEKEEHGNVLCAHSFCERCGVHILRAPNSKSDQLEVNALCLDNKDNNIVIVTSKDKPEPAGIPIPTQWDNSDSFGGRGNQVEDGFAPPVQVVHSPSGTNRFFENRHMGRFENRSLEDMRRRFEKAPSFGASAEKFVALGTPATSAVTGSDTNEPIDQLSIDSDPSFLRRPSSGGWTHSSYEKDFHSPSSVLTPTMREQMKKYMGRHLKTNDGS